jgi:hypothetical protein
VDQLLQLVLAADSDHLSWAGAVVALLVGLFTLIGGVAFVVLWYASVNERLKDLEREVAEREQCGETRKDGK